MFILQVKLQLAPINPSTRKMISCMAVAPQCVLEEFCWQAERDLHQLMVLQTDLHIPEAKMRFGKIGHFLSICSPKMLVFGTERVASLVDLMDALYPMAGPKRPLDANTNLVDLRPYKVACHQGGRAIFDMCHRRFCLLRWNEKVKSRCPWLHYHSWERGWMTIRLKAQKLVVAFLPLSRLSCLCSLSKIYFTL